MPRVLVPAEPGDARQLLPLVRLARQHQRSGVAGRLRHGVLGDLTAAFLQLQLLRSSAADGGAARITAALAHLDAASRELRGLADGLAPAIPDGARLAEVIRRRTAWLLAAPADVTADITGAGTGPDAELAADAADIAEFLLLAVHPATGAARAHIAVRAADSRLQVVLTLTPGRHSQAVGDPGAAEPPLRRLAAALGASLDAGFARRHWQVVLALPPA
jgi:hypothetical protein